MPDHFFLPNDIKETLQKILRASTSPIRTVFRAQIILLTAEGKTPRDIVAQLQTTYGTVRKWIGRFTRHPHISFMEDAARSGRPSTIPAVAKYEVMKFACSDVKRIASEENIWTIRLLQKYVLESMRVLVSKSEICRILNQKDLRPHKVKMWLHSPDPNFREKVSKISSLYLTPPTDGIVLCVDEKSGMQAIERKRSRGPNGSLRLDYEYKRHGTQTLISCFEPGSGKIFGKCGASRKKEDLREFMEEVANLYPTGNVYIIWDNLNIHHGYQWYEFNKRHGDRFYFTYTPVHGSWVNQIEIWFGILQRRVLKNGSFSSVEELRIRVLDFIESWNKLERHPFKWQFRGYIKEAA